MTKKILPVVALVMLALPASAMAAPKPKVNFSKSAFAVAEDDPAGNATITVFRKGNTKRVNQTVTVAYATSDGTAKAGTDYTAESGTLTFAAGVTSTTFTVPVTNNSAIDGARTVSLKLSHPTASGGRAVLGFPSSATLVIADDDGNATTGPTFQTVVASDLVSESAGTEPIFVVRSGDISATADVSYATVDGTALSGTDYTDTHGTLHFPADSVLQEVDVPILVDHPAPEPTRDFAFSLSTLGGTTGQLGTPSIETVTIVNADGTPTFQFSPASYAVAENAGSARLTVIASGTITATDGIDVPYATADGSAVNGVNYSQASDTLSFLPGDFAESFDVTVMPDGLPGDKSFTAALSTPVGGGQLGSPSTATVNVLNTDQGGSGSTGTTTNGTPPGAPGQPGGGQVVAGARQAPCGLTLKAAKKQKLLRAKSLKLTLKAPKACKLTVGTTITQVRSKSHKRQAQLVRALRLKGKNTSLTLQPGKAKTVTVKFTKKTLEAITRALRARKNLVATVVVTERISASLVKRHTLKITIKR